MNKVFTNNGWSDYIYWQTEDRKTLKKINSLIEDICRNGNEGIGKPEPLNGNLSGFWSRRINDKDRLIYKIDEENVYILACRFHYGETQEKNYIFMIKILTRENKKATDGNQTRDQAEKCRKIRRFEHIVKKCNQKCNQTHFGLLITPIISEKIGEYNVTDFYIPNTSAYIEKINIYEGRNFRDIRDI